MVSNQASHERAHTHTLYQQLSIGPERALAGFVHARRVGEAQQRLLELARVPNGYSGIRAARRKQALVGGHGQRGGTLGAVSTPHCGICTVVGVLLDRKHLQGPSLVVVVAVVPMIVVSVRVCDLQVLPHPGVATDLICEIHHLALAPIAACSGWRLEAALVLHSECLVTAQLLE